MVDASCRDNAQKEQVHVSGHRLKSPEKDLQVIFKKLRVDNGPKRLHRKARMRAFGNLRERDTGLGKRGKTFLRKPTFVYKNQLAKQQMRCRKRRGSLECKDTKCTRSSKHGRESRSDSELECEQRLTNKRLFPSKEGMPGQKPSSKDIVVGCSGQYRRAQCAQALTCSQMNFDDTTPEELAAYFDHLLYFPKPMSAMAEMMYT